MLCATGLSVVTIEEGDLTTKSGHGSRGRAPSPRIAHKKRYATTSQITFILLRRPDESDDPLTAVLGSGACWLLAHAIEA